MTFTSLDNSIIHQLKTFISPHKKHATKSYGELMFDGDSWRGGKEDTKRIFELLNGHKHWSYQKKRAERIERIYDLFLQESLFKE